MKVAFHVQNFASQMETYTVASLYVYVLMTFRHFRYLHLHAQKNSTLQQLPSFVGLSFVFVSRLLLCTACNLHTARPSSKALWRTMKDRDNLACRPNFLEHVHKHAFSCNCTRFKALCSSVYMFKATLKNHQILYVSPQHNLHRRRRPR